MAQEFGWAPVGQRLLKEYSDGGVQQYDNAPTARYAKTWTEIKAMKSMKDLVELAVNQMRLLHAVDTFPRGGLCQGAALKEALRRYERLWLPLLAAQQSSPAGYSHLVPGGYSQLVPPLDVALLWHLHRLQPGMYCEDCLQLKGRDGQHLTAALHVTAQQAFAFTDGSDAAGAATAALWKKAYPSEPFYPPAAPGSQTVSFRSYLSADLAAVAVRVPVFVHQLLRACYNQLPFLNRAVDRYAKFLLLNKHHLELQHPIPPLDIALMWSSHMSTSGAYAADCQQLLGRPFLDLPGAGASLWLERDSSGPWRFHWTDTQRAWLDEFEEPFVVPGSGYIPMDSTHPAEQRLSLQLLSLFEVEQPGSTKSNSGGSWRAGAHALYLSWLQNPNLLDQLLYQLAVEEAAARPVAAVAVLQPRPLQPAAAAPVKNKKSGGGGGGGLFACFGCGGAGADDEAVVQQQAAAAAAAAAAAQAQQQQQQQPGVPVKPQQVPLLSEAELKKLAIGFAVFKFLPHSSSHIYWRQLAPRGGDVADSTVVAGAEVELFGQAAANGHAGGSSSSNGRDVGLSDQDQGYVTGDYEVRVAGGQALVW